jgi:hypothetical protein
MCVILTILIYKHMKTCTKCQIPQILDNYYKFKHSKDGHETICKTCKKNNQKTYYDVNIDKTKKYYQDNKENLLIKYAEYRKNNKSYFKKWRDENMEHLKQYRIDNKEHMNKMRRLYKKHRMSIDPIYKLSINIRSLIGISFRNQFTKKSKKTVEILGCTFEEFKTHLEKQFDDKMNWENQGTYWHMDHIKPISLAINEQELIKLNHYTNFRPLFWLENIHKSNKY